MTIAEPPRRTLGARTIAEAFRMTAEDHPDRVAVRTKEDELSLTPSWRSSKTPTWSASRRRGRTCPRSSG
jgi:hypothetical protein